MTSFQQKTALYYDSSNCKWGAFLKQNLFSSGLSLFQYRSLFLANCRKNIWQIFPPAPTNIRICYPEFDDFQNKWTFSILDPYQTGKGDQIEFIMQKKLKIHIKQLGGSTGSFSFPPLAINKDTGKYQNTRRNLLRVGMGKESLAGRQRNKQSKVRVKLNNSGEGRVQKSNRNKIECSKIV